MGRILLLLTVLWIPALAEAQTEPEWQRGVELRRQGQDAAALEVFAALHARTASPASLAQVALAEQALGRWGAAALHLDAALARPDAWVTERRGALAQARDEITRHVGQLEVLVSRAGLTVEVDGTAVGTSPLPGPVPATEGTVVVRLREAGRVVGERRVTVQPGALSRASLEVGAGVSASGGGALGVVGGVSLGVGGGALVGVAVAWALRESHVQRWNSDECWPAGATRMEACPGEPDAWSAAETAAIVLGAAGGALLVAGAVLLIVDASGGGGETALACATGLLGVSCQGRF